MTTGETAATPTPRSALWPLLAAVVGASLAEGGVCVWAAGAEGGGLLGAGAAGLLGFALVAAFSLPAALGLGVFADRAFSRRVGGAMRTALAGSDATPAVAVPLGLGVIGVAFVGALLLGERLIAGLSPKFAAAAISMVTLLVFAGALLGAALVGPLVQRLLARIGARFPRLGRLPGLSLVFGVAGVGLGLVLTVGLSPVHGALPAGGLLGFALGLRKTGRARRAAAYTGGLWALCLPALFVAEFVPPVAQSAVLYRAPYLSVLIGGVHQAIDRDGDGHSPVLMGGDCDDSNKNIHADAQDIAGNKIDENCSGADARPYKPVAAPKVPRPAELPQKTNMVVIMVDALRPDHLSFTGYARPTSPRIDAFRAGATWFQNAYTSAPNTRLAVASLLTGVYAHRLPMTEGKGTTTLENGAQTIAERLSSLGYARTAYTITYVLNRFRGYEQGWDKWDAPWGQKDWSWEWERAAPLTSDAAIKYLEGIPQDRSKPYLLFLHYRCTHDPYYKHEIDFGDANVDKYDSALNHCDTQLGRVFDAVDARADAKETAIFLLSDHGELFGEHGHIYHGETLSEPDARIVFLARVPGAKASTVARPVSLVDVTPTLLELAGAQVPNGVDGWSLLPELYAPDGNPPRPDRLLFFRTDLVRGNVYYNAAGVLNFPLKLTRDIRTRRTELYDVVADPGETDNIAVGHPQTTELSEALESWLGAGGGGARKK